MEKSQKGLNAQQYIRHPGLKEMVVEVQNLHNYKRTTHKAQPNTYDHEVQPAARRSLDNHHMYLNFLSGQKTIASCGCLSLTVTQVFFNLLWPKKFALIG